MHAPTVCVVLLLAAMPVVLADKHYATKDAVTGRFRSSTTASNNDVATITYESTMMRSGWDRLSITTSAKWSDSDQAFGAGFLEGVHSETIAWNSWMNTYGANNFTSPPKMIEFFETNDAWMAKQIAANPNDLYWQQVALTQRQLDGMLQGLQESGAHNWTKQMVTFANAQGDFMDLVSALNISFSDWRHMSKHDYDAWFIKRTHCSALIKVADDLSDIYFGHATWSTYNMMLRIYKTYTFNFKGVKAVTISFSSYPVTIASLDDFYVADSGLSVMETTNTVFNQALYKATTPQTLLYSFRVTVAMRLADNGEDWVNTFAKYNSGTYNNQWMVLDLKRFTPGQNLVPGTLWIAEQIPGQVGVKDVTEVLSFGYWPSYNVPSIKEIFVASGYPEAVKKQGPAMNSYQNNVRAQIFRQRQSVVGDMPAFMHLMQYNNYKVDPISQNDPVYAVASRGDLYPPQQAQCFGAIDAKLSSYSMYSNGRQVIAYSGPTPQQQPFDFATSNATGAMNMCTNNGMPQVYDFEWQHFTPQ
jgi:hypothetical protein